MSDPVEWNTLINIPTYVNAISGCNACEDIEQLFIQQSNYVPLNVFNKHHHDCRYFTKNQLKYPNLGGEVNWFNITSLSPAISAVYDSDLTPNILEALTTPTSPAVTGASSYNPFVTLDYLNAALAASEQFVLNEQAVEVYNVQTVGISTDYSPRISSNIYDLYYSNQSLPLSLDWSSIKYHLEYFMHRRNPYTAPPNASDNTEWNWIDEDVDGNKVWIGERHIFTGGPDSESFQSGSFTPSNPRGTPANIQNDLYNNVESEPDITRELEFANRQIIVYGGLELGRNLTLLPPPPGSLGQSISASGADSIFKSVTAVGNLSYGGAIVSNSGTFHVDVDGTITSTNGLTIRDELNILDSTGANSIFEVDAVNLVGTQSHIHFINGVIDTKKLVVHGNIPTLNSAGYSAVFDTVLVSGGLTIGNYFEIKNDLTIFGDSLFENNVTCCTKANSEFVVGQTDSSIRAGDTRFINWNYSITDDPSLFKVYAREVGAASNLLTLRINETYNGTPIGPTTSLYTAPDFMYGYNTWNGVDIRTTQEPNDVYKSDATWSGLEVKSYLSQVSSQYVDSQYLLWTSNSHAYSTQNFPGTPGQDFPNLSLKFGWIMSDWFRTQTEATSGVYLPLHLIASKDYVDYRMSQLNVASSAFKVNPNNLSAGLNPSINDVITWDGSQWVAAPVDIGTQLWTILEAPAVGDLTLPAITSNTLFLITDEGLSAPFTVHLPEQSPINVGRIIQLKFVDLPEVAFPIRVNGFGTDSIDTEASYYVVVQQTSLQLILAQSGKWYVV